MEVGKPLVVVHVQQLHVIVRLGVYATRRIRVIQCFLLRSWRPAAARAMAVRHGKVHLSAFVAVEIRLARVDRAGELAAPSFVVVSFASEGLDALGRVRSSERDGRRGSSSESELGNARWQLFGVRVFRVEVIRVDSSG